MLGPRSRNARTLARLLDQLLGAGNLLSILKADGEYRVTSGHVTQTGPHLPEVLERYVQQVQATPGALCQPVLKQCSKCGEYRELEAFPNDASRIDGRFHRCLSCERPRWREKDLKRRKKRRKKGRKSGRKFNS